jgi:hypothetical protein
MQFTQAHLDDILALNWPVAARLVAWVRTLAGAATETLPKSVLLKARRILRSAEALIRRLIVIMASRMDIPPAPSSRGKPAIDPGPSLGKSGPPTNPQLGCAEPISFSTEPFPDLRPFTWPSLWTPGMARFTPPTPEELAAVPLPATGLFTRLARLEAALAAPEAAALRLARWIARREAQRKTSAKPVRTQPIRCWGLTPGLDCADLSALDRDRLKYTACAAQAAMCREVRDTS